MKNKRNIIILILSLILGAVAVITGIKLYQLRQESIAPTKPKAVTEKCTLEFTVSAPTLTPTATPIPECWSICSIDTDCPEELSCQITDEETNTKRCVNPECPQEEDCQCPSPTATPTLTPTLTPTSTPTSTSAPGEPTATPTQKITTQPTTSPISQELTTTPPTELPPAGNTLPTIGIIVGGIILGILGLLLAL